MPDEEVKVTLTPEEEAEFTIINAAAFDLIRKNAAAKNVHPACWLVMSVEAKEQSRKDLFASLRAGRLEFSLMDDATLTDFLNEMDNIRPLVAKWREAELLFKQLRTDGNPGAYFA